MRTTTILNRCLLAVAAACLISFAAAADTLELKDGRVLHGQYSGGSNDTIRFVINGETRVFRVDEVASLRVGSDDKNSQPVTLPPPTQNPPANPPDTMTPPPVAANPPDTAPPADATIPPPPDQNSAPPPNQQPPDMDRPSVPPSGQPPVADQPGASQTPPSPSMSQDSSSQNPMPMGDRITVPTDTPITIRMVDRIDSAVDRPGKRFRATLDKDLVENGVLVAPKGTDVYGRLIYASQPGHIEGRAELRLELTSIMINGRARGLSTGEYHLAGKSRARQSAERIGGAAIGGAILGGILGGGQGAAAGAAIGAGAGTAVQLATEGQQVRIPSETLLEFRLTAPLIAEPAQPMYH